MRRSLLQSAGATCDIFCKIVRGELPCRKRYEDDHVLAFDDLHPVAPVHILVVPKRHLVSTNDLLTPRGTDCKGPTDEQVVGMLFSAGARIAREVGVADTGYRLVVNCGRDAQQSVPHLHVHLIAGRRLSWPPG